MGVGQLAISTVASFSLFLPEVFTGPHRFWLRVGAKNINVEEGGFVTSARPLWTMPTPPGSLELSRPKFFSLRTVFHSDFLELCWSSFPPKWPSYHPFCGSG